MNILYFTQYYPPEGHGGSVCVKHIVERLSKTNNLLVATSYKPNPNSYPRTKIVSSHRFRGVLSFNLAHISNVKTLLKSSTFKPDVILSQHQVHHLASLSAIITGKIDNVPVVIRAEDVIVGPLPLLKIHHTLQGYFINELTLLLGKRIDRFLVVSTEIQDMLSKRGFRDDTLRLSPNGVDLRAFSNRKLDHLKEEYGCSNVVILMGSMAPADRVENLINAIPIVRRDYPDTLFVLLGSGDVLESMIHLAREKSLTNYIHTPGMIDHSGVPWFLSNSDVGIGPLRFSLENRMTIPMKLVEYMASSLPVISAPVSRDILIHNWNGLVTEDPSPESVADAICTVLSDDVLS
ncbi:MAG: glycosyltransferase, partial [Candidatus Thorarchaeota archaeon]